MKPYNDEPEAYPTKANKSKKPKHLKKKPRRKSRDEITQQILDRWDETLRILAD